MNLKMASLVELLLNLPIHKNNLINKLFFEKRNDKGVKMENWIKVNRSKEEVNLMSPLTWAYVGDCVYELYIRTKLVNETNLKPHKLHIEAIKYVKAGAQAETLQKIYDELTQEEQDIVRRTRNTRKSPFTKKF